MRTAVDLSTFILSCLKDEEGGRVALYHFLRNFCRQDETVTPELINRFYGEALQLPHWRENKSDLHADIKELLQRFFTQSGEAFRLDLIWDLDRMQILFLSQPEDLYETVKIYERSTMTESENLRVMFVGERRQPSVDLENRVLAVRRFSSGEVVVRTYNSIVRVKGASLLPLAAEQELFYDAGLELAPGRTQKLRPAPHSQVRFILEPKVTNGSPGKGVAAQFVAGFAFRQTQALNLEGVGQEPRIFYPLKRLERFYINRSSDPYYLELINTLDKALRMIHTRTEGALHFARQAFDGGQMAFDQLFPDDKGLHARLRELARWTASGPHTEWAGGTSGNKGNADGPSRGAELEPQSSH